MEATVFWVIVGAAVELLAAVAPMSNTPSAAPSGGLVVGSLGLVLAFLCWQGRPWAFLAVIVLGLTVAIGALPYPPPYRKEDTPFGAFVDAMVIVSQLSAAFFAFSSYRRMKHARC